ncbi:hypothetical protein GCM10010399_46580 [Dactylosporangium fulvum]|uniref:Uncharacterized protein n=1 Tax=Dactylosporangium fulvum TaxID=53359 RepID=A0ABY5W0Q9_9ACTN|nr:hypothetical protein [Dactylosporangium fulvum]UWP83552.1 hypothetical protein Dfulv_04515 [Dactylosporangium fulvum]
MASPDRNSLNWLWVPVPPVLVLPTGLGVHLLTPRGFVPFALFGLAGGFVNQFVNDLRRRPEPPARPGWEFQPPFRLAAAQAGRDLAGACLVVLAMVFVTMEPVALAVTSAVALLPLGLGGLRVMRLLRGTPAVRLTPVGVEVGSRQYHWEALRGLELNGDRFNPRLDLLIEDRRQPVSLRPSGVDANLLFLLDLMGYYRSHPERRGAIGDPEEARHIHGVLLEARLAAGLNGGPTPIAVGVN